MTPIKQSTLKIHMRLIILNLLMFLVSSCKRESETKEFIITDTAQVKREELDKEAIALQREEAAKQTQLALLRTAEAKERIAKSKLMEQQAKLARERLEFENKLKEDKKALEEEVSSIAAASDKISIFVADLRSRQGSSQLKLKSLPFDIKQTKADLIYLSKTLSSYRQGVVTNIRYTLNGKAKLTDIDTVTRKPNEYVKVIKNDKNINRILSQYNNEIFAFELDKVIEELEHENKRLSSSWKLLKHSKKTYDSKLLVANKGTQSTTSNLRSELDKVEDRIKLLKQRVNFIRNGIMDKQSKERELRKIESELGQDGGTLSSSTGLYSERQRLNKMLALSSNTELQSTASSSGIVSNFALQEKGLKDEYESNIRRAFDNVERTVLKTVIDRRDLLEQQLQSAKDDLASIQLILNAHEKGQISKKDMLDMSAKISNSTSESLSSAVDQILK